MENLETKPFYLTSEFWISAITGIYMFGNTLGIWDQIPKKWSSLATSLIAGLYALSRGQAKSGVGYTRKRR